MKHPILGLLLCTFFAGIGTSCGAIAADADVAAYFQTDCVSCHQRKKKPIDDKHLSRTEWKESIDKMLELGKLDPVPSKEFITSLLDWLEKTHGPADSAAAAPKPAASADKQ